MKAYVTFVMVVLAVVGLTFAGCSKATAPVGPGDASNAVKTDDAKPAATPAAPAAPKADEAKPESAPAAAATTGMATETPAAAPAAPAAPAAAAVPAGTPITKENIVGTKWSAGGMIFTFEKDGVLKVSAGGNDLAGTWTMEGTALTVSAMGQDFKAEVQGDKITYEGTPLERQPS